MVGGGLMFSAAVLEVFPKQYCCCASLREDPDRRDYTAIDEIVGDEKL